MHIGGFQKLTLTDYPGNLAAIVFTQGCNLRCPYCYNHALISPEEENEEEKFNEEDVIDFLRKRKGKLDALVLTGGEPILQRDLEEFVTKVKEMGYAVKLDTNGSFPEKIKQLLSKDVVDYVAMDFKGPSQKYGQVTGVDIDFDKIRISIDHIMNSGKPYEFRTTMVPELLTKEDIPQMGQVIAGARQWYLQKFVSEVDLIDNYYKNKKPFTDKEMDEFVDIGKKYVNNCLWR